MPESVEIEDQFAEEDLTVVRGDCRRSTYLCVPSTNRLASPSSAFLDVTGSVLDWVVVRQGLVVTSQPLLQLKNGEAA